MVSVTSLFSLPQNHNGCWRQPVHHETLKKSQGWNPWPNMLVRMFLWQKVAEGGTGRNFWSRKKFNKELVYNSGHRRVSWASVGNIETWEVRITGWWEGCGCCVGTDQVGRLLLGERASGRNLISNLPWSTLILRQQISIGDRIPTFPGIR